MIISYIGYHDNGEIISCITNDESMMDSDVQANHWPNVMRGYATPWGNYVVNGEIKVRPEMPVVVSGRNITGIPTNAEVYIDGVKKDIGDSVFIEEDDIHTVKLVKFPFADFITSL